ncbi:MAG: hypothetical protein WBC73_06605, partial [Phormidesmis sp.]
MKYWEFLIQKEGDQTWLPLEAQQVEILEGRYRVVAHTDRINTPLEIQVAQLTTQEMPPRKRVRQRTGRTNEKGLVVVMPYVYLTPGQWELTCSRLSALDDLTEGGWQYGVQIQVFAHTEEEWSAEWPVPTGSETVSSVVIEGDEPLEDAALTEGALTEDLTEDKLLNEALPLIQAQAELQTHWPNHAAAQPVADSIANSSASDSQRHYHVSLSQQAYLARSSQPMTIVGKVNALSAIAPDVASEDDSQLWIRLQNPENGQIIMEAHRPLSLARLPADFKVQIQLPVEVTTRVILGEVSLRTAAIKTAAIETETSGEASGQIETEASGQILTATAFTITAGIEHLLDSVANQDLDAFDAFEDEHPSSPPRQSAVSVEDRPASIAIPSLDFAPKDMAPAVGVVLPTLGDRSAPPPLEVTSPPPRRPAISSDKEATTSDAPPTQKSDQPSDTIPDQPSDSTSDNATDVTVSSAPTAVPTIDDTPVTTPFELPPMVSQPAQFVGTSILDGDLEADEISAVLEDIDKDLYSEVADLDAFEPPGVEGLLLPTPDPVMSSEKSEAQEAPLSEAPLSINSTAVDSAAVDSETVKIPASDRPAVQPASAQLDDPAASNEQPSSRALEASLDFKALKLKDYFWQRLSALTHESHEEAVKVAQGMKAAGVTRTQAATPAMPTFPTTALPTSDEVVIYDEPTEEKTREKTSAANWPVAVPDSPSFARPDSQSVSQPATQPTPSRQISRDFPSNSPVSNPPISSPPVSNPLVSNPPSGPTPRRLSRATRPRVEDNRSALADAPQTPAPPVGSFSTH